MNEPKQETIDAMVRAGFGLGGDAETAAVVADQLIAEAVAATDAFWGQHNHSLIKAVVESEKQRCISAVDSCRVDPEAYRDDAFPDGLNEGIDRAITAIKD